MRQLFKFLIVILPFLGGCAVSSEFANIKSVDNAILLQHQVLKDSLFVKILLEIENENGINWDEGRTEDIKEDLTQYQNNTEWLITKFKNDGFYNASSIRLWRKWNPFSSTTAVTKRCVDGTKLNKWKLRRDKYSILNTLIHERTHSFCVKHPDGQQTRNYNQCDIAYISGDLAEILMLRKYGVKRRKMNKPICPSLIEKIEKYKLIELLH